MVTTEHHSPPVSEAWQLAAGDGLHLAGELHRPGGEVSGAGVILHHGFGQTRRAWAPTARALARRGFPALAFDARGHGDSGRNPGERPYAGEQFVDDLDAVAARFDTPLLVGASMGGLLGLLAQARAPRFRAMVLVDVTPRWETAGVERILGFMGAHPDGFESLEHAATEIAAYLPHRQGRKSPGQLSGLLRQGADGRWRWHWDPRLLEEFARDVDQHQPLIAAAAQTLTIPVLLVSGGRSDLVSQRTVDEFMALVPHAEHARLADATHMVAGDDNESFTASILDFLSRHGSLHHTRPVPGESR